MKSNLFIAYLTLAAVFVGCSQKNDKSNPADANNVLKASGINCDLGFSQVPTDSIQSVIVKASETSTRTVTLKSSAKYGYNQSAYNLSGNCFSRQGGSCEVSDQLMFNHGGDPKNLSVYGHFILLRQDTQHLFEQIQYENLDGLNLKTIDGTSVTKDTILGSPSVSRKLALGESSIYKDYSAGTTALVLVDDTWSNENFQLFKMKFEKVVGGEEVVITYQRIAEAPKPDLKNYYCSKQTEIKKAATGLNSGSATVYSRSYAGYNSSTFGFDYGVNGFDGKFVRSERVMSFGDGQKCEGSSSEMCVSPYVGWVVDYWGGIIELGNRDLDTIDKSAWPNLQSIDPKTASAKLKENSTYLVSQLNSETYTFGAIRITEIDHAGRWIKFDWKRVAIEKPYRFVNYIKAAIPLSEKAGEVTLNSKWWDETHLDVALAKVGIHTTEEVYFDINENTLNIDNRYFPSHSGIIDVTGKYGNVESVSENEATKYIGQFSRSAQIKNGGVYLVVTEKFWYRAELAIQVVDFVPGKSVRLKFNRVYNGQTFPGQWYRN